MSSSSQQNQQLHEMHNQFCTSRGVGSAINAVCLAKVAVESRNYDPSSFTKNDQASYNTCVDTLRSECLKIDPTTFSLPNVASAHQNCIHSGKTKDEMVACLKQHFHHHAHKQ